MLSLLSTLGGLLISGLPKIFELFQQRQDQKHELALIAAQRERELAMAAQGFAAQAKVEEIRVEQMSIQTEAQMTQAALDHDKKVLDTASKWVANYVGTVRPTVTYLFVAELIAINLGIAYYAFHTPNLIVTVEDFIKISDVIFTEDEMAMLGGIIGFWFGSRGWKKK